MNLPDSQALILKTYLTGIGFFGARGPAPNLDWKTFHAGFPNDPDFAIGMYKCKGTEFGRLMNGDVPEYFGVEITIRSGSNYTAGHRMGNGFCNLAGRGGIRNAIVIVNRNRYLIENCIRSGDLMEMGQEPKNRRRWMFSLDLKLVLRYRGAINPICYTNNDDHISFAAQNGIEDSQTVQFSE